MAVPLPSYNWCTIVPKCYIFGIWGCLLSVDWWWEDCWLCNVHVCISILLAFQQLVFSVNELFQVYARYIYCCRDCCDFSECLLSLFVENWLMLCVVGSSCVSTASRLRSCTYDLLYSGLDAVFMATAASWYFLLLLIYVVIHKFNYTIFLRSVWGLQWCHFGTVVAVYTYICYSWNQETETCPGGTVV